MIIRRFIVSPLGTNCYLVACGETLASLVIDAGFTDESEVLRIIEEIEKNSLNIKHVLSTHWHPDHTAGNEYLRKKTGASILIHEEDAPMLSTVRDFLGIEARPHLPDRTVKEGEAIRIGRIELRIIHTPGHTRGSISLLGKGFVFTGDTLFAGSIGRTDLPGGSFSEITHSIRSKLMVLPDETIVYPGHGPVSSIGRERITNPFLKDF